MIFELNLTLALKCTSFQVDMHKVLLVFLVCVLLVIAVVPVAAYPVKSNHAFWEKSGYFGGNLGFIGTGKVRIDGTHINTQPGFTFGMKLDFRFSSGKYWGFSADIHRLYIKDTGQYFLDLCFNLKKQYFGQSSRVGFRPGLGVGFGHLTQFRDIESSTFLMTRAMLEIIFYSETKVGWMLEVGLIAAPIGGIAKRILTTARFRYFGLGRCFKAVISHY